MKSVFIPLTVATVVCVASCTRPPSGEAKPAGGTAAIPAKPPTPSVFSRPGSAKLSATQETVSLFGTNYHAANVVFVVDTSGSMLDLFDEMRMQIVASFAALEKTQRFQILCYGGEKTTACFEKEIRPATAESKKEAAEFMAEIRVAGLSDPCDALKRADLDLVPAAMSGPNVVFLITDGEFDRPRKVMEAVHAMKSKPIVNTILVGMPGRNAQEFLETVANETGGTYKFFKIE